MDPLLTRILLTIFIWPVAMVLYILSFLIMERRLQDDYGIIWAGVISGFVLCSSLLVVWRRQLRWTGRRRVLTFLTFPAAVVLGLLVGAVSDWLWDGYIPIGFYASLTALAAWPIMAILVWRESPEERDSRAAVVSCPDCGYNLRGLSECRCPECGRQYTLDELYAAQPRPPLERLRDATARWRERA